MLVDVWVYTPFIMILLLAGLRSLPQQPFEAAALDGVPRRFVFFRITLPMLMPYIITATLFRLLDSIQQFDIIYAMTQGGPGDTLLVFQVRAYLEFYQYTNVGKSAALLIILWAITYFAVEHLHQAMAEAARTRARHGVRRRLMDHISTLERIVRGVLITLVLIFFLFPIFWIFLMSFQTNEDILRIPPSLFFTPTLVQLSGADHRQARDRPPATLDIAFMKNLWNSVLLSTVSVAASRSLLGVPAAYAFARFKFRLGEDIAFTLLSFRFAPPLLVLLPLSLYFQQLGLTDTYIGLIWVYQLIACR